MPALGLRGVSDAPEVGLQLLIVGLQFQSLFLQALPVFLRTLALFLQAAVVDAQTLGFGLETVEAVLESASLLVELLLAGGPAVGVALEGANLTLGVRQQILGLLAAAAFLVQGSLSRRLLLQHVIVLLAQPVELSRGSGLELAERGGQLQLCLAQHLLLRGDIRSTLALQLLQLRLEGVNLALFAGQLCGVAFLQLLEVALVVLFNCLSQRIQLRFKRRPAVLGAACVALAQLVLEAVGPLLERLVALLKVGVAVGRVPERLVLVGLQVHCPLLERLVALLKVSVAVGCVLERLVLVEEGGLQRLRPGTGRCLLPSVMRGSFDVFPNATGLLAKVRCGLLQVGLDRAKGILQVALHVNERDDNLLPLVELVDEVARTVVVKVLRLCWPPLAVREVRVDDLKGEGVGL